MSEDIAAQMLTALVAGNTHAHTDVPINEQIRYLIKNVNSLSVADRKSVGQILSTSGNLAELHKCSEGTAIDLDRIREIDPGLITQMYNLTLYKKEQRV